jgi:hypothetical protein
MKRFECNKRVPCKGLGFYPNHYLLPCCLLLADSWTHVSTLEKHAIPTYQMMNTFEQS